MKDSRYLIKRVIFSETEPCGTPNLLWIHTDPVSRMTVYSLWDDHFWHNAMLTDFDTYTESINSLKERVDALERQINPPADEGAKDDLA